MPASADTLTSLPMLHAQLALGLLLVARVMPLALLLPSVAPSGTPTFFGVMIGGALAFALLPIAMAAPHPALALDIAWLSQLPIELLRGAVFALAVTLPLHAFAWAGELADLVRGATAPQLDHGADAAQPLAELYRYGSFAVFFAARCHRLVIDAFAAGLRSGPLGSMPDTSSIARTLLATVDLLSKALALSVELAAPVMLCMLIAVVALGVLLRASAPLVAPLAQGPLLPVLGLAIASLSVALVLPETPSAVRVFLLEAERLMRQLG